VLATESSASRLYLDRPSQGLRIEFKTHRHSLLPYVVDMVVHAMYRGGRPAIVKRLCRSPHLVWSDSSVIVFRIFKVFKACDI
jgi:hypothetical protein